MLSKGNRIDLLMVIPVIFLTLLSVVVLKSIAARLFPDYLFYIVLGFIFFIIFSKIDFRVTETFSGIYYILGILLLMITLAIGKVTRGAVRWIPFGDISIQPSELIRPFLIVFFANYYSKHSMTFKTFIKAMVFALIPILFIFIQPSLSVAMITLVGFIGVTLAAGFNKKVLLALGIFVILISPLFYFLLAPYQRQRIVNFVNPNKDPLGAGYNSIQSMISVGSGMIKGRGLGSGVQTQLAFLPERSTDFVFASISEELGFTGALIAFLGLFVILYRLTNYIENSISPSARAYVTGVFLIISVQMSVNIAMNLGLVPVAGLPLPILSAGGSSYLSTMILLGIASSARKG